MSVIVSVRTYARTASFVALFFIHHVLLCHDCHPGVTASLFKNQGFDGDVDADKDTSFK